MTIARTPVPPGYSDIAPGDIATVVTCLEMRSKPALKNAPLPAGITLTRMINPDLESYRALFRKVGADWLWFSRLIMDDAKLAAILNNPDTHAWVIQNAGTDIGLLELDFSVSGECELGFLGLTSDTTGKGLGRSIMNHAIELAWSQPIHRFWVHTCTFDHPSALRFYRHSGFVPYALQIEVQADPRLSGHLPLDAAPHVPLITPR